MKNYELVRHVRGESQFLDDLNEPSGLLHAAVFYSPVAHGNILSINFDEALSLNGVERILTYKDIKGENQIGGIVSDEELLAEHKVDFIGHPIAIVVAKSKLIARKALKKIKIEIEELTPVLDPRSAYKNGNLIIPPRIFSMGDVDSAWDKCDFVIEGIAESGGQEHLYLETQSAMALPVEGGSIKIISSTQSPTAVQKTAARVLGLPMHKVEVDVLRLGGGFGGKEDQASAWAAMAALACYSINKPVKLILPRQEDMRLTGKRHPYSSDYKIGLSKEGKILAYQVSFYQDAGAAADLSPAILDRTLFHATNTYYVPNVKAAAYSCKTNLTPNTAFRGFGGPQGMFVMEAAIYKAAAVMGIEPSEIQWKNLLKENDEFSYGQLAENCMAETAWDNAVSKFDYLRVKKEVEDFNSQNIIVKKGVSLMPICFGISFTTTFLNQASALVHVYSDGSVLVSTAAVEMGQGVNMKIRQVVASIFSINIDRVKTDTTNTSRVANTSATAASSGADLNGNAARLASSEILVRLKETAAKILNTAVENIVIKDELVYVNGNPSELTWEKLISTAYMSKVALSSSAFYAPPGIFFDKFTNKGKPFAYHVYGTGMIQVKVDCITGVYEIESVKIMHDCGSSINTEIDKSQTEGAVMQGIGWMTIEELIHNEKGRLITDALSTYKVPDIYFAPKEIEVEFIENNSPNLGVFSSKAIGEPPFMYGIAAYFAIMNAMKSFKPEKQFEIIAPMTHERVLTSLYQ